jgi:outer membrane receptor protein involved in Fe transport
MQRARRDLPVYFVSTLALMGASGRSGAADAPETGGDNAISEVVVTGSRITSSGYTQPTPTSVLTAADLELDAAPNLFNTISELPVLQGSTGRKTFVNSTSSGATGLSAFSLRNLGTIRTLTLLDGQRVTPANVTGIVDVSQFPQLLVERVDVVTGGASASYGSDAIGGVVNFVTDKEFVGLKTNVEAGRTTYGDDESVTAQAAWGGVFFDDRFHVQVSGEYGKEDGVPSGGFGGGPAANGRDWFNSPALQIRPISQTTDGRPQIFDIRNAQQYQYTRYGLITNGPLQGTAFGANGQPYPFQYGSNGTPTGTGAVTNCFAPFCVGGDLSGNVNMGPSLAAELERTVGYTRMGFDLTDRSQVYLTVNVARTKGINEPNAGTEKPGNLTIACDNPFLPASIASACAAGYAAGADGVRRMAFGTSSGAFPETIDVVSARDQLRFVVGIDGDADFFGTNWAYNGYVAHGTNHTRIDVNDISLTPRYNAAIDAIRLPDGSIVCRSAAARASGCVPVNIIGNVSVDPAGLAYVFPAAGPRQRSRQEEQVASFNVSGDPFALWAGPVSIAMGLEYRDESYRTIGDPYGNGVYADSPNSEVYPADPVMNTISGNNWYAGNFHNGKGSYSVKEAYLETNLPFLDSDSFGDANLNLAVRQTEYSTAGSATPWKVGGTWKTPLNGLSFRAVTSRDIRAPNLSELFAPPVVVNATVVFNGQNLNVLGTTVGNTDLESEIARNTTFGIVLAEPDFFPGFSISVDYYDIKLSNLISTLTPQQEVDLCVAGNQLLCSQMLLTSTVPNTNFVRVQAFNLAKARNKGLDIEATYRTELAGLGIPGELTLRALATHAISFVTESGIVGTIPVESAGVNLGNPVNSAGIPDWKVKLSQGWSTDNFGVTISERWISDGVYSNEYIECQTNCPVSTITRQTIDNNQMKGALYVDVGGTYRATDNVTAYFMVDNIFNKDPEPAPGTTVSYGINPYLYDALGRMYRVGFRTNF